MVISYGVNPEPAEHQLSLFRYHKRRGTSPGNPKWYRPLKVTPFKFTPNLPPKYPHLPTGTEWFAKNASSSATKTCPVVMRYVDGSTREIRV